MDGWPEQQHMDELARQEQLARAIKSAEKAGTPKDALEIIVTECGMREFFKEKTK